MSEYTGTPSGAAARPSTEEHPQEYIVPFMERFYAAEKGAVELDGLVEVFASGLRRAIRSVEDATARRAHGDPTAAATRAGVENTQSLLKQLLQVVPQGEERTEHYFLLLAPSARNFLRRWCRRTRSAPSTPTSSP